jgi:hypothetical protein
LDDAETGDATDDTTGAVSLLKEMLALMDTVKRSSLVANEIELLTEQLGSLLFLNGDGATAATSPPSTPLPACGCRTSLS